MSCAAPMWCAGVCARPSVVACVAAVAVAALTLVTTTRSLALSVGGRPCRGVAGGVAGWADIHTALTIICVRLNSLGNYRRNKNTKSSGLGGFLG